MSTSPTIEGKRKHSDGQHPPAGDLFAAERYRRGETGIPSYEAYNPFRHRQPGPVRIAPCREAVFSKLDT